MLDAPVNSTVLGTVLAAEADDGRTAVSLMREEMDNFGQAFDLVLIDNLMTNMNGPDAVKAMRNDLHFRGSIVGVTGNALPEDIALFEQCGADCVVTKPLTNKKLMDAILLAVSNKTIV